jgi:hypothetical protein
MGAWFCADNDSVGLAVAAFVRRVAFVKAVFRVIGSIFLSRIVFKILFWDLEMRSVFIVIFARDGVFRGFRGDEQFRVSVFCCCFCFSYVSHIKPQKLINYSTI